MNKEILCLTSEKLITEDFHACTMVILATKKIKKVRVLRSLGNSLDRSENNTVLTFLGTFNPINELLNIKLNILVQNH